MTRTSTYLEFRIFHPKICPFIGLILQEEKRDTKGQREEFGLGGGGRGCLGRSLGRLVKYDIPEILNRIVKFENVQES